ncbi:MAG TPA: hypothetical protein VHK27_02445, partial [Gammaproteobacteria bacterium]|nr:hypothetical protein [Gammaproteobacteria bacterium]
NLPCNLTAAFLQLPSILLILYTLNYEIPPPHFGSGGPDLRLRTFGLRFSSFIKIAGVSEFVL